MIFKPNNSGFTPKYVNLTAKNGFWTVKWPFLCPWTLDSLLFAKIVADSIIFVPGMLCYSLLHFAPHCFSPLFSIDVILKMCFGMLCCALLHFEVG